MTDLLSMLFAIRFMLLVWATKLSRKVPKGSITRVVRYVATLRALPPSGGGRLSVP